METHKGFELTLSLPDKCLKCFLGRLYKNAVVIQDNAGDTRSNVPVSGNFHHSTIKQYVSYRLFET